MSSDSTDRNVELNQEMENHRNDRQQIVDLEFLRGLIAAVDDSGIDSLEISRGGTRIRVAKSPTLSASVSGGPSYIPAQAPAPAAHAPAPSHAPAGEAPAAAPAAKSNLIEITSPMVGTFYRSPSPDAPPYVEVGTRITRGQTLCVLEAMKLMNELQAEVQGVIREVCISNAEPVEYGQVLFRIEPEA